MLETDSVMWGCQSQTNFLHRKKVVAIIPAARSLRKGRKKFGKLVTFCIFRVQYMTKKVMFSV